MLRRAVKAANLLALLCLLTALLAAWRFALRPLADTSGEFGAPVLSPVTVLRDRHGIPHIQASTVEDVVFAQGFVTAQDRMWQMESMRRLAAGQLAEVAGPGALELDRESRRLRLWRTAQELEAALGAEERQLFAAYARGVNHYLETHAGRLPVEFSLLSYTPAPWSVADSLLVALQLQRTLAGNYRTELWKAELFSRGRRDLLEFLLPAERSGEPVAGSNAWVVGGTRTASGRPILANDLHLEMGLPSLVYLCHLKSQDGLEVAGMTVPGIPLVIAGRNRHIAWGITSLEFDVQDLYQERLDLRTGAYLHSGRLLKARRETEVIRVKGGRQERMEHWVTVHGPVVSAAGGALFALQWTAALPGTFRFPLSALNRARNWEQFRAALRDFSAPPLNFLYADTEGNTGYQVAGLLPVREGYRGDVPADGASGKYDWGHFIPFDDLPSILNPPSSILVSANQNPFPPDYRYTVSGSFYASYRARRIRQLLAERTGWTAEAMARVQNDVYSAYHHFLARETVAACQRSRPVAAGGAEAVALLRSWDGQMGAGSAGALLAELVSDRVKAALLRAAAGVPAPPGPAVSEEAVEELLRARPAGWVPDWDRLLADCLTEALEQGRRLAGPDLRRWRYGDFHRHALLHSLFASLPVLRNPRWLFWSSPLHIGFVGVPGAATTVNQNAGRLGPVVRMILDLGAPGGGGLVCLSTGQSGQPFSKHYKDHWPAYAAGQALPFSLEIPQSGDALRLVPR